MMDLEGNIIWEIGGLETGPYYPSPDGRLAIGLPSIEALEIAPIGIYSKNGLMKSIKNLYGRWSWTYSKDGKYI